MDKDYKLAAKKPDGKWWTFGSLKKNKFGNYQASFKNTPELKKFVNDGGEWLNFSLFEEQEKTRQIDPETQRDLDALKATAHDSEIPF